MLSHKNFSFWAASELLPFCYLGSPLSKSFPFLRRKVKSIDHNLEDHIRQPVGLLFNIKTLNALKSELTTYKISTIFSFCFWDTISTIALLSTKKWKRPQALVYLFMGRGPFMSFSSSWTWTADRSFCKNMLIYVNQFQTLTPKKIKNLTTQKKCKSISEQMLTKMT